MTEPRIDWTSMAGIAAVGAISIVALLEGGTDGVLVASAAVGGICGWLARGGKTANIQNAENVQTDTSDSVPMLNLKERT